MKRGLILSLIVCLMLVSGVSATDTEIKINTLSNHSVSINFLNPESTGVGDLVFESKSMLIGETGEESYTFVNDADSFDLSVFVMKGATQIVHETFESLNSGDDITLILFPGIPKESMIEIASESVIGEVSAPVGNETEALENLSTGLEEIENETVEDVEDAPVVENASAVNFSKMFDYLRDVGFVSSEEGGTFSLKNIYYGFGIILIVGILFFVYRKHKHKIVEGLKDLKEGTEDLKEEVVEKGEDLEEAEEELEKAKEKVEKLKSQKEDKIKEVKKRLIEDEKELMELRVKKKKEREKKEEKGD